MSERGAFDRAVASLHEASLDDARWPAASSLVDELVRSDGNSVVFGAGTPEEGIQIYYAGFFRGGQRRRELEREYFGVYHPRDERAERLRRLPDGKVLPFRDMYTDAELKTSAAYNEFLFRVRSQKGLNVRLDGPGGTRIIWAVSDPLDADGWSSAQIESIQRLVPHIRRCVTVRQVLAGARALGASLAELLENTGPGVIQLDGRGRIVDANDRARDVLRTGDGLYDSKGLLFARASADDTALQDLLARALPPFGQQGNSGSVAVTRPAGLPPLVLHVSPVGRWDTEAGAWPVAALMLVVDPAGESRIDPDLVANGLGLTPMESRVAVMLAEGRSVQEIAAATGRKITTVRWHVRHIFNKLDINRQTELVRQVLSIGRVPNLKGAGARGTARERP